MPIEEFSLFFPSMKYPKTTERVSLVLAVKEDLTQPHSKGCQNESSECEHHTGQAVVTHHHRNSARSRPPSCPREWVHMLSALVYETRFFSHREQIKLLMLCFWRFFSAVGEKSTSLFHSEAHHPMQENISSAKISFC